MSIVKEGVSNLNLVGYMNWNLLWHSSYGNYRLKKLLTFDKIWCYNESPPRMAMEQRFKRNKKS